MKALSIISIIFATFGGFLALNAIVIGSSNGDFQTEGIGVMFLFSNIMLLSLAIVALNSAKKKE